MARRDEWEEETAFVLPRPKRRSPRALGPVFRCMPIRFHGILWNNFLQGIVTPGNDGHRLFERVNQEVPH